MAAVNQFYEITLAPTAKESRQKAEAAGFHGRLADEIVAAGAQHRHNLRTDTVQRVVTKAVYQTFGGWLQDTAQTCWEQTLTLERFVAWTGLLTIGGGRCGRRGHGTTKVQWASNLGKGRWAASDGGAWAAAHLAAAVGRAGPGSNSNVELKLWFDLTPCWEQGRGWTLFITSSCWVGGDDPGIKEYACVQIRIADLAQMLGGWNWIASLVESVQGLRPWTLEPGVPYVRPSAESAEAWSRLYDDCLDESWEKDKPSEPSGEIEVSPPVVE